MTDDVHDTERDMGTCTKCRRKIGVYVPRDGDGSMLFVRVHNGVDRKRCPGSRRNTAETPW